MSNRVFIYSLPNSLRKPRIANGKVASHSLIMLAANNQEEANKKHLEYYAIGVRMGTYNAR